MSGVFVVCRSVILADQWSVICVRRRYDKDENTNTENQRERHVYSKPGRIAQWKNCASPVGNRKMWGCAVDSVIGDNGGPQLDDGCEGWVDYRHALMVAIRDDRSLSPRARILGVMVCTYMGQDGKDARPSVRTLADVTGFGVNTIAKIMALIEEAGLMKINRGSRKVGTSYETAQTYEQAIQTYVKGARGRYANAVTNEAAVLSPTRSDKNEGYVTAESDKTGPLSPPESDKKKVKSGFVTDDGDVLSPDATLLSPTATVLSPPESDGRIEDKKKKKESPLPPEGELHDLNNAFLHASYSEGVAIDPEGGVKLVNGTRAYWLKLFDGDELALDLATKEAAGGIQANSKQPIKLQLERSLAKIARETRDKDKRYAKAAARNAKPKVEKAPDRAAIMQQILDDERTKLARG